MGGELWRARYEDVYSMSFLAAVRRMRPGGAQAAYAAVRVVAKGIATPAYERGEIYRHEFDGDGRWYRVLLGMGLREKKLWALAVDVFRAPRGAAPGEFGPTPEERLGRAQKEWEGWRPPPG
jgi:hypothetical protein